MSRFRRLFMRVRATFASDQADSGADADAREEFESHLAMATAEYILRGLSPQDAHRLAMKASGGFASATEAVREQRGLPFLETLAADVEYEPGVRHSRCAV